MGKKPQSEAALAEAGYVAPDPVDPVEVDKNLKRKANKDELFKGCKDWLFDVNKDPTDAVSATTRMLESTAKDIRDKLDKGDGKEDKKGMLDYVEDIKKKATDAFEYAEKESKEEEKKIQGQEKAAKKTEDEAAAAEKAEGERKKQIEAQIEKTKIEAKKKEAAIKDEKAIAEAAKEICEKQAELVEAKKQEQEIVESLKAIDELIKQLKADQNMKLQDIKVLEEEKQALDTAMEKLDAEIDELTEAINQLEVKIAASQKEEAILEGEIADAEAEKEQRETERDQFEAEKTRLNNEADEHERQAEKEESDAAKLDKEADDAELAASIAMMVAQAAAAAATIAALFSFGATAAVAAAIMAAATIANAIAKTIINGKRKDAKEHNAKATNLKAQATTKKDAAQKNGENATEKQARIDVLNENLGIFHTSLETVQGALKADSGAKDIANTKQTDLMATRQQTVAELAKVDVQLLLHKLDFDKMETALDKQNCIAKVAGGFDKQKAQDAVTAATTGTTQARSRKTTAVSDLKILVDAKNDTKRTLYKQEGQKEDAVMNIIQHGVSKACAQAKQQECQSRIKAHEDYRKENQKVSEEMAKNVNSCVTKIKEAKVGEKIPEDKPIVKPDDKPITNPS